MKERDVDNNIIISGYTLRNILTPQLNKMSERYKVICGYECFITDRIMHSSLLAWSNFHLKQLKDQSLDAQNISSVEIASRIFETYKNSVKPDGCHNHKTGAYMTMSIMFPFTSTQNGLPHWKCVLRCCDKHPIIFIPSQE